MKLRCDGGLIPFDNAYEAIHLSFPTFLFRYLYALEFGRISLHSFTQTLDLVDG